MPALTCTEPIRLDPAAATEFEPLGVSDQSPTRPRTPQEARRLNRVWRSLAGGRLGEERSLIRGLARVEAVDNEP